MNGNYLCLYSRMRVRHFSICLINARAYTRILLAYKKKTSHFPHFSHLNLGVRMRATLIPLGVRSVGSVG